MDSQAAAIRVHVLETNVLHASDVIYWLDGASAADSGDMQRVERVLTIEFTTAPQDLSALTKAGRTALLRRPVTGMVDGIATQAERTRVPQPLYALAGVVREAGGLFNPRAFQLMVGDGGGHAVVLYPSPVGTRWPKAGGLLGTLRFADTDSPVAWGVVELAVNIPASPALVFRAQADRKGDFILALNRLPPLPESVSAYSAELRLRAGEGADPKVPGDIDTFVAMDLGETDSADSFADHLDLSVRPGELQKIQSFELDYLAVQAAD